MNSTEVTSIQISKETHHRLKFVACHSKKKLYELINEATDILEQKYMGEVDHE